MTLTPPPLPPLVRSDRTLTEHERDICRVVLRMGGTAESALSEVAAYRRRNP